MSVYRKKIYCAYCLFLCLPILASGDMTYAGTHSLNVGLSTSYDSQKREYDVADRDDDYQRISINPNVQYIFSTSPFDTFEIRLAPSFKYDIEESETDWEYNDLLISFQKAINRNWNVNGSNSFLRTDDQDSTSNSSSDVTTQSSGTDAPSLSNDPGRSKYWRNNLQLGTDYTYQEGSLVHFGFGYNVLRNDSDSESYEDYDRYVINLRNEHQYNIAWRSIVDLSYIRGEYEETDVTTAQEFVDELAPDLGLDLTQDDLSQDVNEYRLTASVENYSIRQNVISISYDYIGSKYDEVLRFDSDIHQGRVNWQRQYSEHLSSTLGAGPSYEKTEGLDANYGGNGIATIDYQMQRSSLNFQVEKRYDVENFSGTDERGFVDLWDTILVANYQLLRALTVDCRLSYTYEKREEPTLVDGGAATATVGNLFELEEYDKNIYRAGLGLSYNFMKNYTAGINYTFTKQESDRIEDEYDDHRIVVTLSWQQEWLRW